MFPRASSERGRNTPHALRTVVACAVLLSGCVTIYQPLMSLQRPAVVDPQLPNFAGQRMLIQCVPGDYLKPGAAQLLCTNVRNLFTNQGAQVDIDVVGRGSSSEEKPAEPFDLVVSLRARLLHSDSSAFLWGLSWLTLTIVPGITESTFAQDVTIRDGQGFVLVSDTLQARIIQYFGVAIWGVNKGLDWIRPEHEKLTGDAAKKDFSRDFHAQLSQLAFHARMRAAVMNGFPEAEE